MEVRVDDTRCIGCGMCAAAVPGVFQIRGRVSTVQSQPRTAAEEGRKQTAPMTSTMKASARLQSAVRARGESFFTLLLYARGKSAYALCARAVRLLCR